MANKDGVRSTFYGTFERTGYRESYGHPKTTILIKNIKDTNGVTVADHLWFNMTNGFNSIGLQCGDKIKFDARVKPYIKGYMGHRDDVYKPIEKDYKLSYPTNICKLQPQDSVINPKNLL